MNADEENQMFQICLHEVAHFVVAAELKIGCEPIVTRNPNGTYGGVADWENYGGTPDDRSAIGWAGGMVQAMTGFYGPGTDPPFPLNARVRLSESTLHDWVSVMLLKFRLGVGNGYLSLSDQIIVSKAGDPFRTARIAFKILHENMGRVYSLADRLFNDTKNAEAATAKAAADEAFWRMTEERLDPARVLREYATRNGHGAVEVAALESPDHRSHCARCPERDQPAL